MRLLLFGACCIELLLQLIKLLQQQLPLSWAASEPVRHVEAFERVSGVLQLAVEFVALCAENLGGLFVLIELQMMLGIFLIKRLQHQRGLFEQDLGKVRIGAAVEVRLNAYPDEVFQGRIESIGRQLDPTARTVVARVSLRNRDDLLKVGLFGKALVVSTDAAPGAARVVVPLAAVTRIADRDVVFVREPNGHFAVHDVTRGRSAAGKVEIVAGLRAGEQVVSDGVFTLKSAVLKSTFGEED